MGMVYSAPGDQFFPGGTNGLPMSFPRSFIPETRKKQKNQSQFNYITLYRPNLHLVFNREWFKKSFLITN
jgi:hypothetical protein